MREAEYCYGITPSSALTEALFNDEQRLKKSLLVCFPAVHDVATWFEPHRIMVGPVH